MSGRPRLVLTVLLVGLAVLGAATISPWKISPPQVADPEPATPVMSVPEASSSPAPRVLDDAELIDNEWLLLVMAVLFGLLIIAVLTLATRQLIALLRARTRTTTDTLAAGTATPTQDTAVDLPELQDAVTRAMAHLEGHARPRDAVVAAWVALEEAAERAGTRRDPAQTPTEFAGTVLAATPAPPAAVARLRTLYQRARFTDRPIDRTAVEGARAALTDIAHSLDVDAAPPTPETTPDTAQGPA